MLAKEIIEMLPTISIPEYKYKREKLLPNRQLVAHEQLLAKGGAVQIDEVKVEELQGCIKPDIEIVSGDKRLFIEVAVTHRVDKKKQRIFRKHDVPAIEIRFSREHALFERDKLEALIKSDKTIKHWLYHPNEKQANAEFFRKYRLGQQHCRNRAKVPTPRSNPKSVVRVKAEQTSRVSWETYDEAGEDFRRRNGRYPSLEETIALWSILTGCVDRK